MKCTRGKNTCYFFLLIVQFLVEQNSISRNHSVHLTHCNFDTCCERDGEREKKKITTANSFLQFNLLKCNIYIRNTSKMICFLQHFNSFRQSRNTCGKKKNRNQAQITLRSLCQIAADTYIHTFLFENLQVFLCST